AGFEPATLRLTAGKRNVSRPLRACAGHCRIERHRSQNRVLFDLRFVWRLAAVCCSLLLRKGKKRATSTDRPPEQRCRFSLETTPVSSRQPPLRHVFADVLSQHFVDQRLVPHAATARFLAELIEHARVDTNRDQL